MTRAVPEAVPLPAGFGIAFDPGTRFVGPDVLFGGSPRRLLRLTAAGARALDELRRLARRAHRSRAGWPAASPTPDWPTPGRRPHGSPPTRPW